MEKYFCDICGEEQDREKYQYLTGFRKPPGRIKKACGKCHRTLNIARGEMDKALTLILDKAMEEIALRMQTRLEDNELYQALKQRNACLLALRKTKNSFDVDDIHKISNQAIMEVALRLER